LTFTERSPGPKLGRKKGDISRGKNQGTNRERGDMPPRKEEKKKCENSVRGGVWRREGDPEKGRGEKG